MHEDKMTVADEDELVLTREQLHIYNSTRQIHSLYRDFDLKRQ